MPGRQIRLNGVRSVGLLELPYNLLGEPAWLLKMNGEAGFSPLALTASAFERDVDLPPALPSCVAIQRREPMKPSSKAGR